MINAKTHTVPRLLCYHTCSGYTAWLGSAVNRLRARVFVVALAALGGLFLAPTLFAQVYTQISAGDEHTCGVTAAGGVKCWGNNSDGQLGDGTTTSRDAPVDVVGLSSGVAEVAAGGNHTCARLTSGGVRCWGYNTDGQLGIDPAILTANVPQIVLGVPGSVSMIAAGGAHTCVVHGIGGVMCWGSNGWGQLGDGTRTDRSAPTPVSGLVSGVLSIDLGRTHSCARDANTMVCWGSNDRGQLADGTTVAYRDAPLAGILTFPVSISAGGEHTCAALASGAIYCAGWNAYGQLGDNSTISRNPSVPALGVSTATQVSAGRNHSCARLSSGGVQCWGRNDSGQIGDDGLQTERLLPVNVARMSSGVVMVSVGKQHSCALLTNGEVWCWGDNFHGQLGSRGNGPFANGPRVKVEQSGGGFSIGGTVSGLSAAGLTLQLNGGAQTVSVPAGATSFAFPSNLAAGATYDVSFETKPAGLFCSILQHVGIASSSVSDIHVSCSASSFRTTYAAYTSTGTGIATATILAPDDCAFERIAFIPTPSGLPANVRLPHGALTFDARCRIGASMQIRIDYPTAIDPSAALWKFDGSTWAIFPATLGTASITYTLRDGGAGDLNQRIDGLIVDPVGVGVLPAAQPTAAGVPTLPFAAALIMVVGMLGAGLRKARV